MSILDELEVIKFKPVLELIKNNEVYDKKKNVLTCEETIQLFQKRYQKMLNILLPLLKKIGNYVKISKIDFSFGMQDETIIVIKYLNDENTSSYISISFSSPEQLDIVATNKELGSATFVQNNRKLLTNIFKGINEYSLDSSISIKSTSNKFNVISNLDAYTIKDIDNKMFSISGNYSCCEKEDLIYNPTEVTANYIKLKKILEDEENIKKIYQHLFFYEEDIENVLSKKLTYR